MSVLADEVAAHDWSVRGARICGKPGRSMATLTWQRHICTSAAVADRGPARRNGILHLGRGERDHDVSILMTVGAGGLFWSETRQSDLPGLSYARPQHGHGWVAWSV